MSPEDYELLLWIMGDRALQVNSICLAVLSAWLIASYVRHICARFMNYLDYKMDYTFWNDLLVVETNSQ